MTATALATAPAAETIRKGRVGLYRPWGSNIDEGWTRWLLEQYRFGPVSLYNADIQKGGLKSKFDTIILPDLRDRDMLLNGLTELDVPEPYAGGISDEGSIALKKFVSEGGTLVALNSASDAVIDLFALPVTNVVKGADADKFFCSGALLQVSLGQPSRATAGIAAEPIVMFWRGPVFQPKRGFKGNVLASYAPTGNPLRSGVLLHPEAIQGKAAALEVEYGKGRIFLYGFRPQWRGQSHGTYKLLFNVLYACPNHEPSATVSAPPKADGRGRATLVIGIDVKGRYRAWRRSRRMRATVARSCTAVHGTLAKSSHAINALFRRWPTEVGKYPWCSRARPRLERQKRSAALSELTQVGRSAVEIARQLNRMTVKAVRY